MSRRTERARSRPRAPARSRAQPVPREESKRETREALVAAALELFAEQGLDAPSLDAICERAGYTRGAFYVHFPDRDALLVAVMEKVGEAFLASLFAQLELGVEPASRGRSSLLGEAARRFVAAIAAGAYPLMPAAEGTPRRVGPQVRPHQLLDACARSPVVRERYKALVEGSIDRIADLARSDQAAGAVRRGPQPRQIGTLALATVIGAQTMTELGVRVEPDELARTLLAMLAPER